MKRNIGNDIFTSGQKYKVDIYKNIVDNLKREILNLKKESVVENKN
ncbi:MAG: hypothetical protein KAS99_04020 [Candidatus Omnitrophica bacterium]|nr:hypothetical protein [Candidatus Omnitrophota bacterium]